MKKVFLLMMLVAFAATANAQWYAGGSLGFWNDDDADETTFKIVPELGYNINSQWAVGAELGFDYSKAGDAKDNVFFVNPYARYTYFNQGQVNLFIDGGVGISIPKEGDTGFQVGLKPGVALNLTDKFALVAKFGFLGYSDAYGAGINKASKDGFGLDLTNNITFGFYVNF